MQITAITCRGIIANQIIDSDRTSPSALEADDLLVKGRLPANLCQSNKGDWTQAPLQVVKFTVESLREVYIYIYKNLILSYLSRLIGEASIQNGADTKRGC